MSSKERTQKLNELRTELQRLKTMVQAGGTVENPAKIGELRLTIARMLTVEHEQSSKLRKKEKKKE
jgi:large subunit ribosomal protein L29